jgi:hypothetical protein
VESRGGIDKVKRSSVFLTGMIKMAILIISVQYNPPIKLTRTNFFALRFDLEEIPSIIRFAITV